MELCGVEVKLNQEATPEFIEQSKSDVVIIATGASALIPNIPGVKGSNVATALDVLAGTRETGERVVIIGGLMQGCELADFLVKRGRKVTVVEASDQLGTGIHEINRKRLLPWLTKKGVIMLTGVTCKEVVDKGLSIITKAGEEKTIEADTILIATPPVSNLNLFNALKDSGKEVYRIGDCKEPRMILDAISDGSRIARAI